MQKIAIVGLGYVGLPLSLQFARSGVQVVGLDIDSTKIEALNSGRSHIRHIESATIAAEVDAGRLTSSTDFSLVRGVDAVIICVPTPLNKNREPDISCILRTGEAIAPHLQPGHLIVLESTTYTGTTDEDLRSVLEKGSVLKAGLDFHLAFSPEREDLGNPCSVVEHIPNVVGGLTPACLEKAKELYGRAIKTLVPVSSCRAAEATKLLENIFRGVNIALVSELRIVYGAMGIDIWEVINASKTKTLGFMAFYPGARAWRTLHSHRPLLPHLEGPRIRSSHALHRARWQDQRRAAGKGGAQGSRGPQRALKISQSFPNPRPGTLLQGQRRRRSRVPQLRSHGKAQATRPGRCLPRSLRASNPPHPRASAIGSNEVCRVVGINVPFV